MSGIGSSAIKQICICVWDLEKAERRWNALLGRKAERLKTPRWSEVPSYTNNRADTFEDVEFLVYHLDGGLNLEIFGPGEGETPWRTFLEKHGEGVMNVAFFVDDREEAYAKIHEFAAAKGPYHEGFYPGGTYTFVDTYDELGVELNIKRDEDNTQRIRAYHADPASYSREI